MGTITKFEDLNVWKLSREVVNEVYSMTNRDKMQHDYALTNQIRRSALSIMSNIAEGFESGSDKQFARYLKIAKGSAGECRAQLYITLDQHYINKDEFEKSKAKLISCSKKLSRLISYLKSDNNRVKELEIRYNV